MQQILDRTEEPLAQSFASLARNARRQQHLYYATVALLVAIVVIAALVSAGLVAERNLDTRRSHVAQYVRAISLRLQNETAFLRRTAMTIRCNQGATNDTAPDRDLLAQVRRTGVALSHDGQYALIVPEATRVAWGDTLPRRLWQLQQTAVAMRITQTAFDLDHRAYVVDADAAYAIVLPATPMSTDARATLRPEIVTTLRDELLQQLTARIGDPRLAQHGPHWIGPTADPVERSRAMISVMAIPTAGKYPATLVAASVPASAFLERLKRPVQPARLWLLNDAGAPIDVSPPASAAAHAHVLQHAQVMRPESLGLTRSGLLLIQPLGSGFGSLVYDLSYGTLFSSTSTKLTIILGLALLLILTIVATARYWDIHLLRRSHTEAARSIENETINHILVSATPIGLCVVRQHDNVILASNAVASSLLGCGQGSRLPPHIMEVLVQQHMPSGPKPFASIAQITVPAQPDVPASAGFPPSTDPGNAATQQFLQITYAPARYRDEAVFFCAIQDATAQHQLEHQLRSAREAAEAMMRTRSNFFASMSHEIRTPLNVLLGNLELLARADGLETHAPRLRALQVASDGLRRIVNDILDFSKIDAGEMKLIATPFRPIDEIESLAMSYAPMVANRPIRFYVHLSPTLDTTLTGDRTRISQIINNLLSNAFKFTSSGKITLSAEITQDAQSRSILFCRVRDSGAGMSPGLVSGIFHPFVQGGTSSSTRHAGTGLGLSICARLTELMTGHITVESVEGVGSVFTVAIPLMPPLTPPTPREPAVRGRRAAIVCQEVESGTTLQAWLESAGWQADVIHGLHAAQSWLRGNHPHVLVVSGEHDLEAMTALRTACPCNIVWITRDGPERPGRRESGIFEVSAFSHAAILSGALAALDDEQDVVGPAQRERALTGPATDTDATSPGPEADAQPRRGTILVAEDNALNQTLVAEQLATLGWNAVVVGDGRQALAVLERGGVDIVLTDIHMPVMDGYELLEVIRSKYPGMPVLAFSAVTHSEQTREWRARGFAAHVAKPASLKMLEQALQTIPPTGCADQPAEDGPALPASELVRYRTLLREHLQTDGPALANILLKQDTVALGHWAHRSAGAFRIVDALDISLLCRKVERLCSAELSWTPAIADAAELLHEAVRDFSLMREVPTSS